MKHTHRILLLVGLFSVSAGLASAQVTTGTPPFGSFGGGPVDTINLANLNAHISIPVFSKAGRGIPFNYNISYDTSIWTPVGTSGSQTWAPTGAFGWALLAVGQAVVTGHYVGYNIWTGGAVYLDPVGTPHSFPGYWVGGPSGCAWDGSAAATDGSGYSVSTGGWYGYYLCDIIVTASNGQVVSESTSGSPFATDTNGNQITISSNGAITDTLGQTALTATGTAPSNTTFTYTAPSGANAAYTMKYTSYTVRTNFACSGISEYGPTAQNLVSEIDLPDGTKYTFAYETTPGYSGDVTGRFASVTLPTGGTIYYTYTGGNDGIECVDGSTAGLTRQTPDGTWTYARTLGSGAATTTTITAPTYNGQSNQTVMNFQGIYQTEAQVYQGSTSGTLLETTYTCYNSAASPCNSTAVTLPITQQTQIVQWPGTGGLESKTSTTYNSYGSVTERDEYAYGAGAPGAVVRKTLTTFASLGNGIVDRPATVTVEDGSNNVKSKTTYTYDQGTVTATSGTPQHVAITGSRGNPTTISYLVSGSTTLSKTFTYYDTGNVNVATDFNGAQTTYTYGGCTNSFPTSVSKPLSLTQSMTWNCIGGIMTSATDENGKTVSATYQNNPNFWVPDSTSDQLSYATSFTYNGQTSVESSMPFNSNNSTSDTLASVDALGRTHIAQAKESPSSSTYDSIETDYDSLGRPDRTTLPYSATYGQTCSGSCPSTSTSYDALGRPTSLTDGGGGSNTYSYSQNDTYQTAGPAPTGENTKRRQLEYDALGRLTSVCEITSGTGSGTCAQTSSVTGYWTKYIYDVNNNLTSVTQNAQSSSAQTRTYAYDDLGRMTSETNPESGTTTYTYDTDATCGTSKGDLVKKVDAVGNTICLTYDALHRLTSTTYSGTYASVTPSKYFVYDSATVNSVAMVNARTHVAEAYTCFSPCSTKLTDEGFSYTARGESSDLYESTPHSGVYYHVNLTYWANGATDVLSGLSGLPTITYNVDGEGRVYSAGASSGQNPLSGTTYNVASLPTAVNLGSSDTDSFGYDSNTNRMTSYQFNVNGQSLVGSLGWNALGTLASLGITDPFDGANAQTCSYFHDDLVRIGSSINPSTTPGVNCVNGSQQTVWSQIFTYDAFGNINKSGTSSFQPTYSYLTNHMTEIGSSYPTYDANGNVTNDFLNTYAWDANGRPVTVNGVSLTYDALGRMVEQGRSGAYTQIVYTPSGAKQALMIGSTLQKGFVPLTGGSMAVYNSSGLAYYRHSDWLGSSRFASTPSRTLYFDGAYAPFGEAYAQTGTTDLSFTGMNQDTASNVYDFPGREYGTQGRWPSPDPAGTAAAIPSNPQSWNRYAYALNSPVTLVDPTGMDPDDPYCEETDCGGGMPDYYGSSDGFGGFADAAAANPPDPCGQDLFYCKVTAGDCSMSDPICGMQYQQLMYPITTPSPLQNPTCYYALNNPCGSGPQPQAQAPKTPWYKNSCVTGAIGSGALHVGIDSIGLIPEAGGLARVIGHQAGYVGVVADQTGSNIIKAVGGSTGTAQGLNGLTDTSPTGLLSTGLTVAGFIPGLNDAAAGLSIALDIYKTAKAISQCP